MPAPRKPRSLDDPESFREWRPPTFGGWLRRQGPEPPLRRWEDVLRAERSRPHRVFSLVCESAVLRRLFRIPPELARPAGPELDSREARIATLRRTALYRTLESLGGRGAYARAGAEPRA